MKKLIIIIYLFQINSILKSQPSDAQWYIWKGMYGENSVLNHNLLLNNGPFSINNVQHSGPNIAVNGGVSLDTKNDVFIIYSDGSYYNSRNILISDPCNLNYNCIHTLQNQGYIIPVTKSVSYMYFSNIYEDDDPPGNVSISQPPTSNLIPYNLNIFYPETISISSNHSVVKGKDYTLIIPKLAFNNCNPNGTLRIGIKFPSNLFTYDTLLNPIPGASIEFISPDLLILNNPSDFNYLNFNTPVNSDYLSNTCYIAVGCYTNNQSIDTPLINKKYITESIDTAHDPNFIMVSCIEEIKPWYWMKKKVIIKYHIEFENDGLAAAKNCKLEFTLPTTVDSNSLNINYWYYGGVQGCNLGENNNGRINLRMSNSSNGTYTFNFNELSNSIYELKGIISPVPKRKAYIDFCVKLNSTEDFTYCDLKPTNCSTTFGTTQYPIDRFIDRDTSNRKWPNRKIKRISKKNCCLSCSSSIFLPPTTNSNSRN